MTITKKFKNYKITKTITKTLRYVGTTEKAFQSMAEAKEFIEEEYKQPLYMEGNTGTLLSHEESFDIEEVK